jgi:spore maturation protein CgeB
MKILIIDRKLERMGWEEKEGEVLKESFLKLGHSVIIAGKGYENSEQSILDLSKQCDFALITENYWQDWSWWDLNAITIPKYIWAIDYDPNAFGNSMVQLVNAVNFTGVFTIDFSINEYMEYNTGKKHYYLPYAIFNESKEVKCDEPCEKNSDILFVGSPYKERLELFPKETLFKNGLFGYDYYEAISRAKINLNWSLTDAINGKVFEIISAKGFLVTNRTKHVLDAFDGYVDVYNSKEELEKLVKTYLNDDAYRNKRRLALYSYCAQHHMFKQRAELILEIACS